MASGTVAYTDTRGNKDYLGIIASQIGRRLKQASNMAAEERAFAESQAEKNNTSLAEAGIGRGHFFKRALGSRFGGDRIARTRGRLGAQGPGTDPTKNYKQRFRGGFDYNYSEQINQVTREVGGAIVPMSSALSVGLRGVEGGLVEVSQSISSIGVAMGQLAVAQQDLARQAMMNGAFMRAFMTYMQRQQSRAGTRAEERSIERGRRALRGGGGTDIKGRLPGAGGTGGSALGSRNSVLSGLDAFQTGVQASTNVKGFQKTGSAIRSLSTIPGAVANTGGAIVKAGQGAIKYLPDIGKLAQNSAKFLGTKVSSMRALLKGSVKGAGKGIVRGGPAHASINAMIDMAEDGFLDGPRNIDNMAQMLRGYGSDIDKQASRIYSGLADDADFIKIMQAGGFDVGGSSDEVIDVLSRPVGETGDLARRIPAEDLPKLAAARTAALDNAGLKATEIATDQIVKQGTKQGLKKGSALARMMVKQFGAAGTKSILKKIPVVAGVAGILFGIQRAMEGDFFGAGLEITSGILGATGVGAPVGLAIDGFLLGRDLGMVPMAKGGLLTGRAPVNALMGEGILDAQRRNKSQFISLHQLPVKKALDDTVAKKSWWDGIKSFFGRGGGSDTPPPSSSNNSGRAWWDPLGVFTGKNDGAKAQTPLLTPPPPVPKGVTGSTAERNLAAFLSTLEATGDQNSMDALQVMLNRTALSKSGKAYTWAGNSLFEQITAEEQFSPYSAAIFGTSADPNAAAKYGNILSGSPEERRRKLMEIASGPNALNNLQTLFKGGDAASASRVLADLESDGALARESRRYIQGRTSFRGYRSGSGDLNRGRGGNFFFNNQGTTGMIDRISPLPFTSLGTSELQSQQLNQSSAENLRSAFNMPTIINNYNTTTVASGDGGGESSGAAFTALGLDAFTLPFSLASKA